MAIGFGLGNVMPSRWLCGYCGLNHDMGKSCPVKQEHTAQQRGVDETETAEIFRYKNMSLLAITIHEARKRAEVMDRLERTLENDGQRI
jgi:hypothetical protein